MIWERAAISLPGVLRAGTWDRTQESVGGWYTNGFFLRWPAYDW